MQDSARIPHYPSLIGSFVFRLHCVLSPFKKFLFGSPCVKDLNALPPRNLDVDLDAVCKAAQAEFDWKRVPFVLEAGNVSCSMFLPDSKLIEIANV